MATHSKSLERMENKRVYNLLENLCISQGMKMPKLNIIDDDSLNAFASGISERSYSITLSKGIIEKLNDEELEGVIAHELSHIKRFDYLINLLINAIQTILYFNPFVKAFIKITETEREKSCDEMVIQFQYNSLEYASSLLELEKVNHSQRLLALSAAGNKNDLLHRIENILDVPKKKIINVRK